MKEPPQIGEIVLRWLCIPSIEPSGGPYQTHDLTVFAQLESTLKLKL